MIKKNKILGIISAVISGFLFLTTKAQAFGTLDNIGGALLGGVAGSFISLVSYALLSLIGLIISVVAAGTNKILELNMRVLTSPVVETGWTICRDIANLGFVLVLIIIALATVLRFQSYGYQKLLIKLIAAAIIVNFSLTIAGFILDFTNVVASFFITKAFGNLGDIANGLLNVFQPQKFFNFDIGTAGGIDFAINSIMHLSTGVIFSLLTLIILICFMILFLIRYVFLTILLVVSPIAWLMWTLPDTQSLYKKWWTKFLHWCFFAPACLFFLYLAMIGFNPIGNVGDDVQPGGITATESQAGLTAQVSGNTSPGSNNTASEETSSGIGFNSILVDVFDNIINIIVFGGLMVGGLLAANSFGLEGAKAVVGAGTAASKAGSKWLGKKALKYPAFGAGTGLAKLSDKAAARGNTGIFGGLNKLGLAKGVAGARKVAAIPEKIKAAGETKFGKAVFGKDSLLGSTWAAAKKESGLFKKGEKKENLEKELSTLYGRQKSLTEQVDRIEKSLKDGADLSPQDISNHKRLKDSLAKVMKEIEEKEEDLGKVLGSMGGEVNKEFQGLIQNIKDFEKGIKEKTGEAVEKQKDDLRKLKAQLGQGVSGGLKKEEVRKIKTDFEKVRRGEEVKIEEIEIKKDGKEELAPKTDNKSKIITDVSEESFQNAKKNR